MTFDDILTQVLNCLQRQGRASYRALRRRYDLDDAYLDDLKAELLLAHPVRDEQDRGLVWMGDASRPELRLHALLPMIIGWLRGDGRVMARRDLCKYLREFDSTGVRRRERSYAAAFVTEWPKQKVLLHVDGETAPKIVSEQSDEYR